MALEVGAEVPRHIVFSVVKSRAVELVIGQLHHIIIVATLFIPANMQDVYESWMAPRDRLELLNTLELPVKGLSEFKVLTPDDLHRTQRTCHALRQPDFAIGPGADALDEAIVRDVHVIAKLGEPTHGTSFAGL
jgi:hypothetical protein